MEEVEKQVLIEMNGVQRFLPANKLQWALDRSKAMISDAVQLGISRERAEKAYAIKILKEDE